MTALPHPLALPEFPCNLLTLAKELANSHPDRICGLSVGALVDPTPQFIHDVLVEAPDARGYPSVVGARQPGEAIFAWGACRRMTDVGVKDVIPTIGSREAITWFLTLLDVRPGDIVPIPEVAYPTCDVSARLVGATPVSVDPARPDTWPDAAPVFLNSPGNPDGHILSIPRLRAALAQAREHEAVVISDECYTALPWTTPWIHEGVPSVLDEAVCEGDPSEVIVLYSLSEQSNLAGYRAVMAHDGPVLIVQVAELHKHSGLVMPTLIQHAMTLVLADNKHIEARWRVYEARRDMLLEAVESLGLVNDPSSTTGLYLWVAEPDNSDSWALVNACARLGIPMAPGDFYGKAAKGHVRITLTASDEGTRATCERLQVAGPLFR